MSGAQVTRMGIMILLVSAWTATGYGAAKPPAPKPSAKQPPAPKATVQPAAKAAAPAGKTEKPKLVVKPESLKPAANVKPVQPALESPATFTPDMSLGRAIDILRRSLNPPVPIVVLWRDLEERASVTPETPIRLDGVPGLRMRQYLDLLLRSVSAGTGIELGFVVDSGVVVVATKESLPKPKLETRVYDISDLAAPPSTGMIFGPMMPMSPMMSPYGNNGMQPYGANGSAGMPYNGYPGNGYNPATGSNPTSYPQGPTGYPQRAPAGSVVLGS